MRVDPGTMHETLSWTLLSESGPEWRIADLMAMDLDPGCRGVIELLTSGSTTLDTLVAAKSLFKTLRLEGETPEDRRLGAHLYAGAIAAAMVGFRECISRQREDDLRRAFERIRDDLSLPPPLRRLADRALAELNSSR